MGYSLTDTREEIIEILEENKYLTSSELAYMLRVSPSAIREWREKLGIECLVKINTSFMQEWNVGKEYPLVEDPKVWDNREWFVEQYEKNGYGRKIICKMINRDSRVVRSRFKRYNIAVRDVKEASKSKNPCCTREWLEEHYVRRDLSQRKCGKIAGVNPQTIVNWLVKFGMSVRNISESLSGRKGNGVLANLTTPPRTGKRWQKPDESDVKKNNKRT